LIDTSNPVIVQSDMSVLLEVMNPKFEEARDALSSFAELQKSPEFMFTYKITPLSLWNAASSGISAEGAIDLLRSYAKHELPELVIKTILDNGRRYGKVRLIKEQGSLYLECEDESVLIEIKTALKLPYSERIIVSPLFRGQIKQILLKMGYPVMDLAGYGESEPFRISLNDSFDLRWYQSSAMEAFYAGGSVTGGSGVIVLPCGAGKTVVGLAIMEKLSTETLILTTGLTALRQWRDEILDKTAANSDDIGEYSGENKEIKPITITTYQILTKRAGKGGDYVHFDVFNKRNWGLVIYDEVHMLPAPVFRVTSEIQSKRRLGLTATLVREDGLEGDVFSLIGSKKYDLPWKTLEKAGYIATAYCTEIRVNMEGAGRHEYAVAPKRNKFRIASENRNKLEVVEWILEEHANDNILIIGLYIEQLKIISDRLNVPIISGSTKSAERDRLYKAFRAGDIKILIVSKVANFAIDLPDANTAIEVSGTFGSRQEEAQRLGRILRPKLNNSAWFYTIVTDDSVEIEFSSKRQMFLTEQGYKYKILQYDNTCKLVRAASEASA
jgi:DNA excision repair protein ERCC-3